MRVCQHGSVLAAYFLKVLQQRKEGVRTVILGIGDKPSREKNVEKLLMAVTIALPLVELVSVFWNLMALPLWWQMLGAFVAFLGVVFLVCGMLTMKDSWRAGIPEGKETDLVTSGIYRLSRNPAFLGFDLLYLGVLMAFPNAWHAMAVAAAAYLLHQ